MIKIHRAWLVTCGCAIIFFCVSGLAVNAFSIYLPYIISEKNFSNTQTSMLLTMRSLTSFLGLWLTGILYEHISFRKGLTFAGILSASGFLLFGLGGSYPVYLIASMLLGFGLAFGGMVPIAGILVRWFKKRLALATGICSCITGFSTIGFPSLSTFLTERFGLSAAFLSEGLFVLLCAVICFLLVIDSPAKAGIKPYGSDDKENAPKRMVKKSSRRSLSQSRQAYAPLPQKALWILVPTIILCGGFTSAGYSHLSVLMTGGGMSVEHAAIVISLSGAALILSKFLYGFFADLISAEKANYIFGLFSAIGLFLCSFSAENTMRMTLGVILYSFGLGMTTVGLVVWAGELFAPKDFERTSRIFQISYAAGGLIFAPVPGMLADRFGGSYCPAYLIFAIGAAFSLIIICLMYRKAHQAASFKEMPLTPSPYMPS